LMWLVGRGVGFGANLEEGRTWKRRELEGSANLEGGGVGRSANLEVRNLSIKMRQNINILIG